MNSDDIKTWQAQKVHDRIRPVMGYLNRLKVRLERRGFPSDDPFYRLVSQASDAMHCLSVETHSLSVKTGMGRPPRE